MKRMSPSSLSSSPLPLSESLPSSSSTTAAVRSTTTTTTPTTTQAPLSCDMTKGGLSTTRTTTTVTATSATNNNRLFSSSKSIAKQLLTSISVSQPHHDRSTTINTSKQDKEEIECSTNNNVIRNSGILTMSCSSSSDDEDDDDISNDGMVAPYGQGHQRSGNDLYHNEVDCGIVSGIELYNENSRSIPMVDSSRSSPPIYSEGIHAELVPATTTLARDGTKTIRPKTAPDADQLFPPTVGGIINSVSATTLARDAADDDNMVSYKSISCGLPQLSDSIEEGDRQHHHRLARNIEGMSNGGMLNNIDQPTNHNPSLLPNDAGSTENFDFDPGKSPTVQVEASDDGQPFTDDDDDDEHHDINYYNHHQQEKRRNITSSQNTKGGSADSNQTDDDDTLYGSTVLSLGSTETTLHDCAVSVGVSEYYTSSIYDTTPRRTKEGATVATTTTMTAKDKSKIGDQGITTLQANTRRYDCDDETATPPPLHQEIRHHPILSHNSALYNIDQPNDTCPSNALQDHQHVREGRQQSSGSQRSVSRVRRGSSRCKERGRTSSYRTVCSSDEELPRTKSLGGVAPTPSADVVSAKNLISNLHYDSLTVASGCDDMNNTSDGRGNNHLNSDEVDRGYDDDYDDDIVLAKLRALDRGHCGPLMFHGVSDDDDDDMSGTMKRKSSVCSTSAHEIVGKLGSSSLTILSGDDQEHTSSTYDPYGSVGVDKTDHSSRHLDPSQAKLCGVTSTSKDQEQQQPSRNRRRRRRSSNASATKSGGGGGDANDTGDHKHQAQQQQQQQKQKQKHQHRRHSYRRKSGSCGTIVKDNYSERKDGTLRCEGSQRSASSSSFGGHAEAPQQQRRTILDESSSSEEEEMEAQTGIPIVQRQRALRPGAYAQRGVDADMLEARELDFDGGGGGLPADYIHMNDAAVAAARAPYNGIDNNNNHSTCIDGNKDDEDEDNVQHAPIEAELHEDDDDDDEEETDDEILEEDVVAVVVDGIISDDTTMAKKKEEENNNYEVMMMDEKGQMRTSIIGIIVFSSIAIVMVVLSISLSFSQPFASDADDGTSLGSNILGWKQIGREINGTTQDPRTFFGDVVAISKDGTKLAITAPGAKNKDKSIINTGEVRIFEQTNTSWKLLQVITGTEQSYKMHMSLATSSDMSHIAIGYPHLDGDSGLVHHYMEQQQQQQRTNDNNNTSTNLVYMGTLYMPTSSSSSLDGGSSSDTGGAGKYWYGYAVDMSSDGTILAVSAPLADDAGYDTGTIRIYKQKQQQQNQVGGAEVGSVGFGWEPIGVITGQNEKELLGYSMALRRNDGLRIVVGSPFPNDETGAVRVFDYRPKATTTTTTTTTDSAAEWEQVGDTLMGAGAPRSLFGTSLAMSYDGKILAVGAPGLFSEPGRVYVYREIIEADGSSTWIQHGNVIIGGEAGEDFGTDVSLSDDGTILAIGCPDNDWFGNDHGRIQILTYNANDDTWIQHGGGTQGKGSSMGSSSSIGNAGVTFEGSRFGTSIALSSNGTRVVGGANHFAFNTNIPQTGAALVYEYIGSGDGGGGEPTVPTTITDDNDET